MILLQILDEGQLTDSQGRRVDFRVSKLYGHRAYINLISFRIP
jgi:hypothetical protein